MNTNDTKNFMEQMKWRNVIMKCNKEKAMQEEIMELKAENKMLKRTVSVLSDTVEKTNEELKYMKEHFIPVND